MSTREEISLRGEKRFVRRDDAGKRKTSVEEGSSLPAEARRMAKTSSKPGQGDRGDHPVQVAGPNMSADPFDLTRFVAAQAGVFDRAVEELRAGQKRSHWMWFIFPQLKQLGRSATAQHFGIGSLAEASAYIEHPVLGPRLEEAVAAVQASPARDLRTLFGSPDDLKFRSSMTLFSVAAPGGAYENALDRWCDGRPDQATLDILLHASKAP